MHIAYIFVSYEPTSPTGPFIECLTCQVLGEQLVMLAECSMSRAFNQLLNGISDADYSQANTKNEVNIVKFINHHSKNDSDFRERSLFMDGGCGSPPG